MFHQKILGSISGTLYIQYSICLLIRFHIVDFENIDWRLYVPQMFIRSLSIGRRTQ